MNGDGVAHCSFCNDEIPSIRYAYRKVTGWEHERKAGGTNAIRVPVRHDEFACKACIDALSEGRSPGQATLL